MYQKELIFFSKISGDREKKFKWARICYYWDSNSRESTVLIVDYCTGRLTGGYICTCTYTNYKLRRGSSIGSENLRVSVDPVSWGVSSKHREHWAVLRGLPLALVHETRGSVLCCACIIVCVGISVLPNAFTPWPLVLLKTWFWTQK